MLLAALSAAAEPVPLAQVGDTYTVGPEIEHFEDRAGTLSLNEVMRQGAFRPLASVPANFGYTPFVHWFRLAVQAGEEPGRWLLEIPRPALDRVDFYATAGSADIVHQAAGDLVPFAERMLPHRNLVFELPLRPHEATTVYLRVQSNSSLQLPVVLWKEPAFYRKDHREQLTLGIYYGVLAGLLVYNLLLFLSIRDVSYLYYVGYIGTYGLLQASVNGLAFEYFWPQFPTWADIAPLVLVSLAAVTMLLFTRSFLQLHLLPRIDRLFTVLLVVFIAYALMFPVTHAVYPPLPYEQTLRNAIVGTALVGAALVLASGFMAMARGIRQAYYFLLAWTLFLIGIMGYVLKTFGWLPHLFVTEYGVQIGSLLEVVLLSFALAYRMKLLKEDNERIQRHATERLEQTVRERTSELEAAMQQLSSANESLKEISLVDRLTGVKNRKFFDENFAAEWRRAVRDRDRRPLALLILDLDHFKVVNDTYGHVTGDEVLKHVAGIILRKLRRPADNAIRYGGEEFAVILPGTDGAGARHVAESIRMEIESTPARYDGRDIPITVSIGVATSEPSADNTPENLFQAADRALYEAKRAGRNRVVAGGV